MKTEKISVGTATKDSAFGSGTLPYFIRAVLLGKTFTEIKGETFASLAAKVRQEG